MVQKKSRFVCTNWGKPHPLVPRVARKWHELLCLLAIHMDIPHFLVKAIQYDIHWMWCWMPSPGWRWNCCGCHLINVSLDPQSRSWQIPWSSTNHLRIRRVEFHQLCNPKQVVAKSTFPIHGKFVGSNFEKFSVSNVTSHGNPPQRKRFTPVTQSTWPEQFSDSLSPSRNPGQIFYEPTTNHSFPKWSIGNFR